MMRSVTVSASWPKLEWDVHLVAVEQANAAVPGVEPGDRFRLRLELLDGQSTRIGGGATVVRDDQVLVAAPARRFGHRFQVEGAVRPRRVRVDHPFQVGPRNQR